MAAKRLKKDDGMGEYFPTKLYNHLVGETGVFHSTERIIYVDVILGKNWREFVRIILYPSLKKRFIFSACVQHSISRLHKPFWTFIM